MKLTLLLAPFLCTAVFASDTTDGRSTAIEPGSAEAAKYIATEYTRLIFGDATANELTSTAPTMSGEHASIKAVLNGKDCTIELVRDSKANAMGWDVRRHHCAK